MSVARIQSPCGSSLNAQTVWSIISKVSCTVLGALFGFYRLGVELTRHIVCLRHPVSFIFWIGSLIRPILVFYCPNELTFYIIEIYVIFCNDELSFSLLNLPPEVLKHWKKNTQLRDIWPLKDNIKKPFGTAEMKFLETKFRKTKKIKDKKRSRKRQ